MNQQNLNKKLTSYAVDMVSFLLKNLADITNVKTIILFGSVARGEASEESDVDLFVELYQPDKKIAKELEKLKNDFFTTARFTQYWRLLDVENEFNIISGTLEEWKELKNSVIANGVVLYGKFTTMPDAKNMILFSWESIKPNTKRVLFNKKIFGYKQNKKMYPGLLQKYHGKKVGKGSIIIPAEAQKEVQAQMKQFKVNGKIIRVLEYS